MNGGGEPQSSASFPIALLRHEHADGAAHFDLLVANCAPTNPDAVTVPTYRLARRPDLLAPHCTIGIEPIALHRERYLTLSQAVALDHGRGTVTPLRQGSVVQTSHGDLRIRWNDGELQRWRIERDDADWTLSVLAEHSEQPQ